ncbi:MAG: hypothetical protein WCT15_02020 [Candidatus Omnitrophota bacterium]
MKRAFAVLFLATGLLFSLYTHSQALDEKEVLKAKLTELRNKKAEMTNEYNALLHKAALEFDGQIAKVKEDYRKARESCVGDRNTRFEVLRKDYEGRLKPMLAEEENLVVQIGSDVRDDFAKTKAMRKTGK